MLRSCCWEGEGGGREKAPFFIILRCILICTSDAVSVMDDTEGKITAQKAQQRGKKIKEIPKGLKNGPLCCCILIRGWGLGRLGRLGRGTWVDLRCPRTRL